jgi:hypothetical protein
MNLKNTMTRGNDLCAAAANRLAHLGLRMRVRKLINDFDFDRKAWLRRVGLQPYSQMAGTLGTGLMFIAGAVVGAVAGMAATPMRGQQFRQEIRQRALAMMAKSHLRGTQQPAQA